MSKMFKDEVYDNLDHISVLVEPWIFSLQPILDAIPDIREIHINDLSNAIRYEILRGGYTYYNSIYIDITHSSINGKIHNLIKNSLDMLFTISTEMSSDAYWDIKKQMFTGNINLKVEKAAITEDLIKDIARRVVDQRSNPSKIFVRKLLEIIDPHNNTDHSKSREVYGYAIRQIIDSNIWNIRSDLLLIKLAHWINIFLNNGSQAAYINILNLKCMVHNGNAIYSLASEEEV